MCVRALTLPPQLVLDSLHPSLLLDKVVDDLRRLSILQLSLGDAAHVKQVLQFRVQVVQLLATRLITDYSAQVVVIAPFKGSYEAKVWSRSVEVKRNCFSFGLFSVLTALTLHKLRDPLQ